MIIETGRNQAELHNVSSIELADRCSHESVRLLLTSTPYPGLAGFGLKPQNYNKWWYANVFQPWYPALCDDGVMINVIMFPRIREGDSRQFPGFFDTAIFRLPLFAEECGLFVENVFVWDKLNAPPISEAFNHSHNSWEFVFVFTKGISYPFSHHYEPYQPVTIKRYGAKNSRGLDIRKSNGRSSNGREENKKSIPNPKGAMQGNILRVTSSGDLGRPRVTGGSFPRELARRMIGQYSEPGDLVADPFMGAGTTGAMALELGRNFIGGDISSEAYDTAANWIGSEYELARDL